jgi:hypothetical protein
MNSNPSQTQLQQLQTPGSNQMNNRYPANYQPMQNTFVGQPSVQPMQHQSGMTYQNGQQMMQPAQQYGYQGAPQYTGGSYNEGSQNQGYQNQGVHPQEGYRNQMRQ